MEGHLRPGAYEAHVALEHIEKLRQLVQAELADKAAKLRLARIDIGAPAGLLRARDAHAAELEHLKGLFVPANTLLTKQNRTRTGELHTNSNRQHHRAAEDNQHQ